MVVDDGALLLFPADATVGDGPIVIAQITIPTSADVTALTANFQGHTQERYQTSVVLDDATDDWQHMGVVFELSNSAEDGADCEAPAPAPAPAPTPPICAPGVDISGVLAINNSEEGGDISDLADHDGDGVVNVEDILAVLSQYRREGCGNFADVNGPDGVPDCVVDVHDLLGVLANFRCAVATPDGGDQGR
jgi:hypothetical protein